MKNIPTANTATVHFYLFILPLILLLQALRTQNDMGRPIRDLPRRREHRRKPPQIFAIGFGLHIALIGRFVPVNLHCVDDIRRVVLRRHEHAHDAGVVPHGADRFRRRQLLVFCEPLRAHLIAVD